MKRRADPEPRVLAVGDCTAAFEVDSSLFSVPAILRACYKLTDRAWFFLSRCPEAPHRIALTISTKSASTELATVVGDLTNELVDQQIRERLAEQAGPLRELLVAQAFSEGNLLEPERHATDYQSDPRGIGRGRHD